MKSIIVGTAGHIDHGKTALVKALTGIDADRLQEEKRRGITIDLGFAHVDLPTPDGDVQRLGFVDVPGHERFIRNMLAGAGGIDLVLLVIAADESIKPQTREHFDILQLLGVQSGITVLTKSDAVDAETLDVVRLEVEELLRGTFLEAPASPIVAVSSLTGTGLEELKDAIITVAAKVAARDSQALARLPIDRVFTMKGFGTVVTGTLVAGTIRREDELEVYPTAQVVRVRSVQIHGQAAETALAGQRTALNLVAARTDHLARGMTLGPPKTFNPTRRADILLQLLPSAPRAIKDRTRVHFHSYTMETVAEIVLHERQQSDSAFEKNATSGDEASIRQRQLAPGQQGFARIKLPEERLLAPGDRFIIRQFSPVITIGGGVVLDPAPVSRMAGLLDFLTTLGSGDVAAILTARVSRRGRDAIAMSRLTAETGWTRRTIEAGLAKELREGRVVQMGESFLSMPAVEALKLNVVGAAGDFHARNPLVGGISREELRERVRAAPPVFDGVLETLLREKKIEIAGELVRLPGRGVAMKDDEAESKKKIEDAFAVSGLKVPALQEVIAGVKVDGIRAQKLVTLLLRDKVLVKISNELVFHRNALEQLRAKLADHKKKSATIDVTGFKELTGVSRKYAIPLLEYLDRERVTKRVGDAREIL
jgi:selenocysteine-specific elongation factor